MRVILALQERRVTKELKEKQGSLEIKVTGEILANLGSEEKLVLEVFVDQEEEEV